MGYLKKSKLEKLYGFCIWAAGIGFILAIVSIIYNLVNGEGIGFMALVNVAFTFFAYIYFRKELKVLRETTE